MPFNAYVMAYYVLAIKLDPIKWRDSNQTLGKIARNINHSLPPRPILLVIFPKLQRDNTHKVFPKIFFVLDQEDIPK